MYKKISSDHGTVINAAKGFPRKTKRCAEEEKESHFTAWLGCQ